MNIQTEINNEESIPLKNKIMFVSIFLILINDLSFNRHWKLFKVFVIILTTIIGLCLLAGTITIPIIFLRPNTFPSSTLLTTVTTNSLGKQTTNHLFS